MLNTVFNGPVGSLFGFHNSKISRPDYVGYALGIRLTDKGATYHQNILVALNCIPVIGSLIAGVIHIARGIKMGTRGNRSGSALLIGRGVAEIVAGPLVALIDFVVTFGRLGVACHRQLATNRLQQRTDCG